ncbi:signal peptidase II [Calditerrivibrio nitroreducens]|uniref:Lipoprotein signal peptidase n=1 Tax=Calditerrivibrio nitroreducens (strain DSM 19672 / NBRC 101217 / Yu37-1) TaxID=768670 RepID=E4TI76_CALNY|nr:signal peptidase II [Calditerrivibrio nitroreducens]ADR18992.1 signal peptidase II [Calditerrivibrio nitroreducens DSM 19672]
MSLSIFLIVTIIVIDQWTKKVIVGRFNLYDTIAVIDGFFNITYVLNPGAAFGFLAKMSEQYRVAFFVLVTVIAIAIVVYLLIKEKSVLLRRYAYTLILAGAIGNLIDRITIGKVVDFLDFYIGKYHWPAFNVADISISVGVGLLILDMLMEKQRKTINNSNDVKNIG